MISVGARCAAVLCCCVALLPTGCRKTLQATDPELKPVQTMLESRLPVGTRREAVEQFLAARGYVTEAPQQPGTLRALVTSPASNGKPATTVEATFYFDATGKLNTFGLARASQEPAR